MAVDSAFKTNPDTVAKAKLLCFAICKTGAFLDLENGCCSVCPSADECGGWVPYYTEARQGGSNDQQ